MEKSIPARAQNKLEDLHENLVKPIRYNCVEFILAGKKISLIHNGMTFSLFIAY